MGDSENRFEMSYREVPGIEEAFTKAKVVLLTTFGGGEEHTRQMTNLNEGLTDPIWFPTERDTRKVRDIQENSKVLITFPAQEEGSYYELEGEASLAPQEEVMDKWQWWWLYWHPTQRMRFWFPPIPDGRRAIINVKPLSARLVKKD